MNNIEETILDLATKISLQRQTCQLNIEELERDIKKLWDTPSEFEKAVIEQYQRMIDKYKSMIEEYDEMELWLKETV